MDCLCLRNQLSMLFCCTAWLLDRYISIKYATNHCLATAESGNKQEMILKGRKIVTTRPHDFGFDLFLLSTLKSREGIRIVFITYCPYYASKNTRKKLPP